MGMREELNRHPNLAAGIVGTLMVLALLWSLRGQGGASAHHSKLYYTVDDGATLFADDADKTVPFDHDGQQAVLAFVYTCDGGKHQFVQFVEKVGPSSQKGMASTSGPMMTRLVKKPGSSQWAALGTPQAMAIIVPNCPSGGSLDQVLP